MSYELLEAACAFADADCCVIPTKSDGSKAPAVTWKRFQTDLPSTEQLADWFGGGQFAGFGVVCGSVSGGLELLEFEGRAIGLVAPLRQLLTDNGHGHLWERLSAGYVEQTPSGGLHFLYRVDGGTDQRNTKLARRPSLPDELTAWRARQQEQIDSEAEPLARQKRQDALDRITEGWQVPQVLIETRGEGGYVVVAPSSGTIHPSGIGWQLLRGGPATIPTISADDRDLLYWAARQFDRMPEQAAEDAAHRTFEPGTPVHAGSGDPESAELRPGDDYNLKADWADILEPHGWRQVRKTFSGPGIAWARPGKDHGPSATTGTAETGDRLYVFSSSTTFEPERPYSKFAARAHLDFGDDLSACASALRHEGYGAPLSPGSDNLSLRGKPAGDGTSTTPTPPPGDAAPTGEGDPPGGGQATAPPAGPAPLPYTLTDDGNALRLVDEHAHEIRYCPQRGSWLRWVGTHWAWDDAGTLQELARELARSLPVIPGVADTRKHKLHSLNARGLSAATQVACTDGRITINLSALDSDPYQLNTPAGAIDLVTGTIVGTDKAAMHSKLTGVAPERRQAVAWQTFLTETFCGDSDLIAFAQRLAGYSATGLTTHHILPFLHGEGGNGKGVFLEVLSTVLGDYATSAPARFLMAGQEQHETEIARLDGMRLVVCSEINQRDRFDEAKVKLLTGGDALTARFMRQDHFTFRPTHKLWLMGNHQPRVDAGGESFWRRLRLLPFTRVVPKDERNEYLAQQLIEAEGPAILQWVVDGAVAALATGLTEPASVLAATEDYANEEDAISRFVSERLKVGGGEPVRETTAEVRHVYEMWCHEEGEKAASSQLFGRELRRFQIGTTRSNGRRYYTNVTILGTTDSNNPEDDELRRMVWPLGEQ